MPSVGLRQWLCLAKSSTAQTDELVVDVAIEVWGAHAPSRAVVGASPMNFPWLIKQKHFGEAPKCAREGACAPRKEEPRGDHAGLKSSEKLRTFVQLFTPIKAVSAKGTVFRLAWAPPATF
jgi:hypothetical protein